jgi:hypothetical protein
MTTVAHAEIRPTATERISPELVLVSPELRDLFPPALWNPRVETVDAFASAVRFPTAAQPQDAPRLEAAPLTTGDGPAHLVTRWVLYAAWQMLMGALFGLAAVGAVLCLVVAVTLVR